MSLLCVFLPLFLTQTTQSRVYRDSSGGYRGIVISIEEGVTQDILGNIKVRI